MGAFLFVIISTLGQETTFHMHMVNFIVGSQQQPHGCFESSGREFPQSNELLWTLAHLDVLILAFEEAKEGVQVRTGYHRLVEIEQVDSLVGGSMTVITHI